MLKQVFVEVAVSGLIILLTAFIFIKLVVAENNRMLACGSGTPELAFTHPIFGNVLRCKIE
ncbi:hypothetical protein UFOVP431_32 [uncultured Caudovirales phage]|uniref:Uncharacterized protein n=1 Tax=uncultured Caudovirales phage TaxID=2100421 RepID=A0A6J5MMD2_9CAUD|nr:hypothetical protein UFOVP431_32 [uncultured Caudovirales phage]